MYTGLLYNEWFSRPVNLFNSAWRYPEGGLVAEKIPGRTYAFGVDPVWKDTQTELAYYNSLKMKMSVIFGVAQMMLGLVLKLLNSIHFKQWKDVIFEFIPEVCRIQYFSVSFWTIPFAYIILYYSLFVCDFASF